MCFIRNTNNIRSICKKLQIFCEFLNGSQINTATLSSLKLLTKFLTGLNAYNSFISNIFLWADKLLGKLVIKVCSIRNNENSRRRKVFTFHQHTGKEKHCITLAATCRSKVCTTFTISFRAKMSLDILIQFIWRKELRITAHYFQILIRVVWEINKIFGNFKQTIFSEKPLYHCYKRIDTVQFFIVWVYLSPRIKEIIWTEERTIFIICSVTDNNKRIVFENLRNISTITDCKLLICVHYSRIFLYRTLKFKNNDRNTIYEHNAIWNTQLIIYALNFKLINRFENIVFGSVEINKFNIEVFLRSILTVKNKAIAEQLKYSFVCFINRAGNITQH